MLGDLLGRGGMAEVFAGHSIGDHGFQKPVAIKRLLPELASDHVFVERLIHEAKLLVGMQHGNIVSVLDLARDGDDVFLVMEFVDGPSLRQLLKARNTRGLSIGTATYIVQTAATGLEFAHSRPGGAIIHADISPSNLLLTTSGEVRVADFGIARREGGGYGVVEGKWAYMAPEQARGEPLTPRSDVFALGVVLYELITGAHPFGRQVTHEERDSEPMRVIPPRVVMPSVPPGLDAICMRALAHDPRDRYARMQPMIDALVEERFANQYREGASDLAQAIRECSVQSPVLSQPRTQITDRPVTIVTRSLIEQTPHRRSAGRLSNPSYSQSRSATGTPPPVPESGAQTMPSDELLRAALLELPPMLRADGTPMPPFRLSNQAMHGAELDSVIGGNTATGALPGIAVGGERSNTRWTIAILGIAALIGAVAAAVIQLTPTDSPAAPSSQPVQMEAQPPAPSVASDLSKAIAPEPPAPPLPARPTIEQVNAPTPPPDDSQKTEEAVTPSDEVRRPSPTKKTQKRSTVDAQPKSPMAGSRAKDPPGYLRVGSDTFAQVTVGSQTGEVPGQRFVLPPGKHTVRVKNALTKQTQTFTVVIESEKTYPLRVEWEDE
ncbi:MAG: serine/threonine protein kinase [Myxococcota bacterium]|nr:serine/threonine protein kinase [Deltaproteobacteria bacterium]MDQ3338652.1 serine/threonine protein kinase [Myxococcota bacterium]